MNDKPIYVAFADKKTENLFEELKEGENKKLYEFINRAINDLKKNPTYGSRIPKKLWPKIYIQT